MGVRAVRIVFDEFSYGPDYRHAFGCRSNLSTQIYVADLIVIGFARNGSGGHSRGRV